MSVDTKKVIYSMIGVSKFYDKKPVLKDIYLSYFYGAKIGVLGLNGAGKSTLLLQTMCHLAGQMEALYITGEESLQQVAMRAQRRQVLPDACGQGRGVDVQCYAQPDGTQALSQLSDGARDRRTLPVEELAQAFI